MKSPLLLLPAFGLLVCASASATPLLFFANLTGGQEVPPVVTNAQGFSTLWLDQDTNLITVSLLFAGLSSPQTAAHIHGPAAPGQIASPIVTFPPGSFLDLQFSISDQVEGWIMDGLAYVNVHSTAHPGGEIRGQYTPEPATAGVLAMGIGALLLLRRKHRAG